MEPEKATVIPLHHCWKYLNICCDLLNEEWSRSETARMHSLKASCDKLPVSLILILTEEDTNEELVIGHSKVSPIPQFPSACFVESVVIAKKFRGKGWGKFIMLETEKFAKGIGKTIIYLSTSDKEQFYSKIGYKKCDPISIYGCKNFQLKNNSHFTVLFSSNSNVNNSSTRPPPPAPLPPPLPSKGTPPFVTKTYMAKIV